MNPFSHLLSRLVSWGSQHPVPWQILRGPLKGCRWTLFPTSSYWRGHYEPDCTQLILRHLPKEGACWDIGAHFGYFTLLMARHTLPHQQVVAFEPSSQTYQRLCLHLRWNQAAQVLAFPWAASEQDGEAHFLNYGSSTASNNHLPYPGEWVENPECSRVSVKTVSLDALRTREQLQPPGLVKIDVEGHGAGVLAGMKATLRDCLPVVIYSVHTPEETRDMNRLLQDLGYDTKPVPIRDHLEADTDYIALPPGTPRQE